MWANGKKGKTFVRAAGTELAYQSAYSSDTAQLNEAVFFEYTDASGMSQRTTDKTGAAVASGFNGEGAAVELDPLGGNVGLYSPYFTFVNPPAPEDPSLFLLGEESPQYVNGQRVTCQLDGLAIGCNQAYAALENGSAIPAALAAYQNLPGFSFQNNGLGIFTSFVPGHWEYINGNHSAPNDDVIRVYTDTTFVSATTNTFYFSNISWSPTGQNQQDKVVPLGNVARDAQKLISGNKDCENFIKNLLERVAEQTGNPSVANPFAGNIIDFSRQTYKRRNGTIGEAAGKAYGRVFSLPDSNGRRESYGIVGISPQIEGFIYASIDYIQDYIHESIHNAGIFGTYSDRDLATASYNLIKSKDGKPISGLPKSALEEYEKLDEKDTEGNSNFYDKVLQHFCPGEGGRRSKKFRSN